MTCFQNPLFEVPLRFTKKSSPKSVRKVFGAPRQGTGARRPCSAPAPARRRGSCSPGRPRRPGGCCTTASGRQGLLFFFARDPLLILIHNAREEKCTFSTKTCLFSSSSGSSNVRSVARKEKLQRSQRFGGEKNGSSRVRGRKCAWVPLGGGGRVLTLSGFAVFLHCFSFYSFPFEFKGGARGTVEPIS